MITERVSDAYKLKYQLLSPTIESVKSPAGPLISKLPTGEMRDGDDGGKCFVVGITLTITGHEEKNYAKRKDVIECSGSRRC